MRLEKRRHTFFRCLAHHRASEHLDSASQTFRTHGAWSCAYNQAPNVSFRVKEGARNLISRRHLIAFILNQTTQPIISCCRACDWGGEDRDPAHSSYPHRVPNVLCYALLAILAFSCSNPEHRAQHILQSSDPRLPEWKHLSEIVWIRGSRNEIL